MKIVFLFLALVLVTVNGGLLLRDDDALPTFEDDVCPQDSGLDLCVKVAFPNGMKDMLLLARNSPTSTVYEGVLKDEDDVFVVLIDAPEDSERIINFDSDNSLHCDMFDVDMKTGDVSCTTGGVPGDDEEFSKEETNREITDANTKGPIVPLGGYYGTSGIPVNILFTFDTKFVTAFGDAGIEQVIALVKNAYRDKKLKKMIGTTVQVSGTKKKHTGAFTGGRGGSFPNELQKLAGKEAKYDAYTYVTYPGSSGVAFGGVVCDPTQTERINFNSAYGPNDCNKYQPPKEIKCTKSNRIALTSETIAHEVGHNLGMAHDFDQQKYNAGQGYVYRKYQKSKEDCRGLMDYIDDGVGWSACSARDFSRYLTSAGTKDPCLKRVRYHKTADGKLCSENGFSVVDDLTACKEAARAFGDQFRQTEDVSDWPKGCYEANGVYFNQHGSGSANINAAQICKGGEAHTPTTNAPQTVAPTDHDPVTDASTFNAPTTAVAETRAPTTDVPNTVSPISAATSRTNPTTLAPTTSDTGCACAGKSNEYGEGSECKLYRGYNSDWYNGVWCYADIQTCSDAKAHPSSDISGYGASRAACFKENCTINDCPAERPVCYTDGHCDVDCVDKSTNCANAAHLCDSNASMRNACPKTCGDCNGGCCDQLVITSSDGQTDFTWLGIYRADGRSNGLVSYKKDNEEDYYLHFTPTNYWTISSKAYIGTSTGFMYGDECSSSCPESCALWNVLNDDDWEEETTLSVKCPDDSTAPTTAALSSSAPTTTQPDITYVQGNKGSATCHVGSAITSADECKVACDALNKNVGGVLTEGKTCYIAGTGRCKQDGGQNPRSHLVCKKFESSGGDSTTARPQTTSKPQTTTRPQTTPNPETTVAPTTVAATTAATTTQAASQTTDFPNYPTDYPGGYGNYGNPGDYGNYGTGD